MKQQDLSFINQKFICTDCGKTHFFKNERFIRCECGNDIINIILNSKMEEAKQKKIIFTCELDALEDVKMCDILGKVSCKKHVKEGNYEGFILRCCDCRLRCCRTVHSIAFGNG